MSQKMNQKEMIKKLKKYIENEHITQTNYADFKDVNKSFISRILKGKQEPTQDILNDISLIKVRRVSISYWEMIEGLKIFPSGVKRRK